MLNETLEIERGYRKDMSEAYDKGYAQGKADTEFHWRLVSDELPNNKEQSYWVCTNNGYQCQCRWTDNIYGLRHNGIWRWHYLDIPQYTQVVAWMPLPELPAILREEQQDE